MNLVSAVKMVIAGKEAKLHFCSKPDCCMTLEEAAKEIQTFGSSYQARMAGWTWLAGYWYCPRCGGPE